MFCNYCGAANPDEWAFCGLCGKTIQVPAVAVTNAKSVRGYRKVGRILVGIAALLSLIGFVYYRANQEFIVTGQVLYKAGTEVRPSGGAKIFVYEDVPILHNPNTAFGKAIDREWQLELHRENPQFAARMWPSATFDEQHLQEQILNGCSLADVELRQSNPPKVTDTWTDAEGRFWLKLKRGKYILFASNQIQTYQSSRGPTSGAALWEIPFAVNGETKLVSAQPECSPD